MPPPPPPLTPVYMATNALLVPLCWRDPEIEGPKRDKGFSKVSEPVTFKLGLDTALLTPLPCSRMPAVEGFSYTGTGRHRRRRGCPVL